MKIPLISLAILGGQAAFAASAGGGQLLPSLNVFQSLYTGLNMQDGRFYPSNLVIGYVPWLAKRFLLPIVRPRVSGMHLPISIS
jgi:hypothetical protein